MKVGSVMTAFRFEAFFLSAKTYKNYEALDLESKRILDCLFNHPFDSHPDF